jgi:hypothetical protein
MAYNQYPIDFYQPSYGYGDAALNPAQYYQQQQQQPTSTTVVIESPKEKEARAHKKPSTVRHVAGTLLFIYSIACTLIVTLLLLTWKRWILKYQLGCDTRQRPNDDGVHIGTSQTKGLLAVIGGFDPLVSPPAYMVRVGRAIDTPLKYNAASPAEMRKNYNFFAYSNRASQSTPAVTLHGNKYFIDLPSATGTVGFAAVNYRWLDVYTILGNGLSGDVLNLPMKGGGGGSSPSPTPQTPTPQPATNAAVAAAKSALKQQTSSVAPNSAYLKKQRDELRAEMLSA